MKKILSIIGLACLSLFISCEKETEGISFETHYAVFDYQGDRTVLHELDKPFVDPGTTAKENGKEVVVKTLVTGAYTGYSGSDLKISTPDLYTINYEATNSDGFKATETRDVYVAKTGDLINSIEGLYTSTVVRNGATSAQYTNMEYVIISKTGNNKYKLTCGIGGYYQLGRAYGIDYASPAEITANNISANDFTFSPFVVGGFGGPGRFTSFTVNPASKTINFTSEWVANPTTTYTFVVTLKQVQI